jgi:formiminoglutamase
MHPTYSAPELTNWTGRPSEDRAYLHENIRLLDLGEAGIEPGPSPVPVLLGYCCDAGVARNLGRPGAAAGPSAFRAVLGRMPVPAQGARVLWDAGDFTCAEGAMEATQEGFAKGIGRLLEKGCFPLGIGGGHDISYAHYLGMSSSLGPGVRVGILNLDAHMDLRRPEPLPHSGSPFFQIAALCKETGRDFRYCCLGARRDANPRELWDRAADLGVTVIERSALWPTGLPGALSRVNAFLNAVDVLYLTIDLDGFASAYAPGVSAPSPMGFTPEGILPILDAVLESKKLKSMDIAELNPAYDRDSQTAVLAASLVHHILSSPALF